MKILTLSLLVILIHCSISKEGKQTSEKLMIYNDINWFMDTVRSLSPNLSKYYVYTIDIDTINEKTNEYCFSLNYISSSYDLHYIQYEYVWYYKDQLILLNNFIHNLKKIDREIKISKITISDSMVIIGKLFPKSKGAISGTTKGAIFYKSNNTYQRKFYKNSDEMPEPMRAFKKWPEGIEIKKRE